jgi:alkyl hydroperoxide reductase subunit AhpF
MAILSDAVKQQLHERFKERLANPVSFQLYTKPGSGRLILPAGLGCPTCDDARELVEGIQEASPDQIQLQVIDVSREPENGVEDVPTLMVSAPGEVARISFMGLPAGYEFATVVDAIERVSRAEAGLSEKSIELLGRLDQPAEVLVFVTPT